MVSSGLTKSTLSNTGQHIHHRKGSARPAGWTHKSHRKGENRGGRADVQVDRAEEGTGFLSKLVCAFCHWERQRVGGGLSDKHLSVTWDAVIIQHIQPVLKLPNGTVLKLFFIPFSVCFMLKIFFSTLLKSYRHISLVLSDSRTETLIIPVQALPTVRIGPRIWWHVNTLGTRYTGICQRADKEPHCLRNYQTTQPWHIWLFQFSKMGTIGVPLF